MRDKVKTFPEGPLMFSLEFEDTFSFIPERPESRPGRPRPPIQSGVSRSNLLGDFLRNDYLLINEIVDEGSEGFNFFIGPGGMDAVG